MESGYILHLERDEELIAQLLTRDAWSFFNTFSAQPDVDDVKEIPPMPRNGRFCIPSDPELLAYYLNFAGMYFDELSLLGWSARQFSEACESFLSKLETVSGRTRRAAVPEPPPARLALDVGSMG